MRPVEHSFGCAIEEKSRRLGCREGGCAAEAASDATSDFLVFWRTDVCGDCGDGRGDRNETDLDESGCPADGVEGEQAGLQASTGR